MTSRFICPHCHNSIDPQTLEAASSAGTQYRVCPECDEPVMLFVPDDGASGATIPVVPSKPPSIGLAAEGRVR